MIVEMRGEGPVAAREALGQLWEACRPYLLGIAHREWPAGQSGKGDPADAVQETLLNAGAAFDQFRGQTEQELLGWLRTILLHVIHRYAEPGGKVPLSGQEGPPDPQPSPEHTAIAREEDRALADALARLPGHYRQVVLWRNFDALPFEEIGRRSDRSAEAARKVWVRAVEQLQQLLVPSHERA